MCVDRKEVDRKIHSLTRMIADVGAVVKRIADHVHALVVLVELLFGELRAERASQPLEQALVVRVDRRRLGAQLGRVASEAEHVVVAVRHGVHLAQVASMSDDRLGVVSVAGEFVARLQVEVARSGRVEAIVGLAQYRLGIIELENGQTIQINSQIRPLSHHVVNIVTWPVFLRSLSTPVLLK